MLRVILDDDNDLPAGGPKLGNGIESARTALQAVFSVQAGEWPYNLVFGMRWRQEVFGKYFNASTTQQLVALTANTVPDIEPVTSSQITIDTTTYADVRQANITIDPVYLRTATGVASSVSLSAVL